MFEVGSALLWLGWTEGWFGPYYWTGNARRDGRMTFCSFVCDVLLSCL